jgi:methylated-DNA-[protein]-cysteine S-methyltransferase
VHRVEGFVRLDGGRISARMQTSLFDERQVHEGRPRCVLPELTARSIFETPLGWMEAVSDESALLSLGFCRVDRGLRECVGNPVGSRVMHQVQEYFDNRRQEFDLPMRLLGTPFQVRVWKSLRAVPFGTTLCYSELAERLGVKNGQRAVGMANRVNPVAIVVPCHRVIQADGQLCGYAGGLWRKQQLLGLESGQRGLF